MTAIYLIGFMGAGKTTVGKELAKKMGYAVIDTDEQIVNEQRMTINEIFQRYGEPHFRELETEILKKLPGEKVIVTTGGGIILREENRQLLRRQSKVIFLDCHPKELMKRLKGDTTRPLLKDSDSMAIIDRYEARLPLYREVADSIIHTTGKSVDEIVTEIMACLY